MVASEPIDATKLALKALRALDDGQRAVKDTWTRLVDKTTGDPHRASNDRRQPPEIW